jgi:hypothetical protein
MQRLSAWVRWVLLFIFGSQFALEVFKQVAERIGLYDRPREAAGTILNFFLSLGELPWLRTTTLVLGSFVAGVWLDWLLRKFDGSRAKAREHLGIEMTNLAHDIDNALAAVGRFSLLSLPDFSPRLMSAFIKSQAGRVMDTRRSNAPQRRHGLSQTRRYAPQRWAFCGGEAGSPRAQRGFRKESKAARLTGNNLVQQS